MARQIDDVGFQPMLDLVWRDRMTPVLRALIDAFAEAPAEQITPAGK